MDPGTGRPGHRNTAWPCAQCLVETLDEIGQRFNISSERVRQLGSRLAGRIHALTREEDWRSVRWEVFELRRRIGAYAPLADANGSPPHYRGELRSALLLWLAGYRALGDRLHRDGFSLPTLAQLRCSSGSTSD